jgi:Protein of unknown function (DUF2924)
LETEISRHIAQLPNLGKAELLKIWHKNFAKAPPPKLRKQLMVPILAYRIQEREFGGLSLAARNKLREIAKTLKPGNRADRGNTSTVELSVETGSRLIRSWHGEMHEVNVTEQGFEYRGQQYSSLSRIARVITGTQWSGPAFFGTRKKVK